MWLISSGRRPFSTNDCEVSLMLDIQGGKRENIIDGTPIEYSNLYAGNDFIIPNFKQSQ